MRQTTLHDRATDGDCWISVSGTSGSIQIVISLLVDGDISAEIDLDGARWLAAALTDEIELASHAHDD